MKYEVVCTKSYLDVGLLIDWDSKSNPTRVLARSSSYNMDSEYGGVGTLTWIKTGVFLSKDEWKDISYNKSTDNILEELGIKKIHSKTNDKKNCSKTKEENKNMTTFRKEIFKLLHAISLGAWMMSIFVAAYYNNITPMWISFILMTTFDILKN